MAMPTPTVVHFELHTRGLKSRHLAVLIRPNQHLKDVREIFQSTEQNLDVEEYDAEMESMNKSLGKVSIGVPSKPRSFTFVPLVQKLPVKSIITEVERSGALTEKANKNLAASHKRTTEETMSDGEAFKAEIVYIKDSTEGGAGNETNVELKPPVDHMSLLQTSPSASDQAENTPRHLADETMETAVGKHRGMSPQQCHDTACGAEVSSGFFASRAAALQDKSPTNSYTDLFPTPASSRESILSDGWDKEKSWSTMQLSAVASPVSFSRTVSPCSSVRSGYFSPAVVRVKRHCLEPGSSLVQMPQSCFSSCESLSSSVCPQSPPSRHRPPLTRLSLLTAILRKGRLPILSSAQQRPYSPCWPINLVNLSSCNACSAASSVASIPLEFLSRFPSSATEGQDHSHFHREPYGCATAPPPLEIKQLNRTHPQTAVTPCSEQVHLNSRPTWERVTSSPPQSCSKPIKNTTLPQNAPQLCCSPVSKSVSAAKHQEIAGSATFKNMQRSSVCSSKPQTPERKASNTQKLLKGPTVENTPPKINSPSPKPINEQETSVAQQQRHHSNSSLSNLRSLSQQLRSLPSLPGSRTVTVPVKQTSFHPLLQNTEERRSKKQYPERMPQVHCLSPSRYTPIVFPGWPSPSSSPTPDRFMLTPSPAPPIRDLTPSPPLSLRSTPSPRPGSGISDCSDREGKKRKQHKIKSSYKSFAAIPTNTLLLDQQVIDDQVERRESDDPCDTLDTHAEMCSPAQLRQKSEELYAVIDEILADSIPACKTSRSPQPSRASTSTDGVQRHNKSFVRPLGRETKYASLCCLYPPGRVERNFTDANKTKPGVIRPMTAIPRLTVEGDDEFHLQPFRRYATEHTVSGNRKVRNMTLVETQTFFNCLKGQTCRGGRNPDDATAFSMDDLRITESEDHSAHSVKDGSWQNASTSFSPTEGQMQAFEAHI